MLKQDEKQITTIPPHSDESERALLVAMLHTNENVEEVFHSLKAEDFYNPRYKIVIEAMFNLYENKVNIDIATLTNKLIEMDKLVVIEGETLLTDLAINIRFYSNFNIKEYITIIYDKSLLRKLIKETNIIASDSYASSKKVEEILNDAEERIFNIRKHQNGNEIVPIKEILSNGIKSIEKACLSKETITGLATGFRDLDIKMAGLQASDLILIAARPSMGKTAFALNIVQNIVCDLNKSVIVFSLEMSKEQLINRLISSVSLVEAFKLRTGLLKDEDWVNIITAVESLSETNLHIDDTAAITVSQIRSKCRKIAMDAGLDLIVIDYLQLMTGKGENRQQEISKISRELKALAREFNVPIIALSQLSRAVEQRADHRPMLSDLRESGAIEQDADIVSFLYRDDYYNKETEYPNQAELIIAKHRNGPTGTINLVWCGEYTKFEDMENSNDIIESTGGYV